MHSYLRSAVIPTHLTHSCSTFLFQPGTEQYVGHNLDDDIEVPGCIAVNPRGTYKESLSWADLCPEMVLLHGRWPHPSLRFSWESRFGSITYNTNGKEFINGGMNEAGLYMGEMTLSGTRYPDSTCIPHYYHHLLMQYLLDCFQSVPEVLDILPRVIIDGHCQWHFFLADSAGNAAVIEYIKGGMMVYSRGSLPYPVLANAPYARELEALKGYSPYGGDLEVDLTSYNDQGRFTRGVELIRQYRGFPGETARDYALRILHSMKGSSNKWGLLYDMKHCCLFFYTYKNPQVRWVDFHSFDFSPGSPSMVLDIHQEGSGDMSHCFTPFDPNRNQTFMSWKHIRMPGIAGWLTRTFILPQVAKRMNKYASSVRAGSVSTNQQID